MSEIKDFMLTTFDNPINPFENFDVWWKHDLLLGHDTCGLLARTASTSDVFSEKINRMEIQRAMDEICENEPTLYKKVQKKDYILAAQA